MRTFATLTVAGVVGILLFKLVVVPILALFVGLLAMTVKLALLAAVIFFVYSMIKRRNGRHCREVIQRRKNTPYGRERSRIMSQAIQTPRGVVSVVGGIWIERR